MLINLQPLSVLIWSPIIIGSLLLLCKRKTSPSLLKWIAIFTSFICLCLCGFLAYRFNNLTWRFQFAEYINWLPLWGIKYALGIDGFSLLFIILTCLLSFLVLIFALHEKLTHAVEYYAIFLFLQGLLCGVFAALDAILFYLFFEAMLIPMFLLIGIWGGNNRIYATIKFFLFTVVGSISLLISLIYLLVKVNQFGTIEPIFSINSFHSLLLTATEQRWLFWGILLAFAVKLPMLPVHTWLPDAHAEAPTGGSVILAAIVLKIGGYGILRFLLPVVPNACFEFAHVMLLLSIAAIVYIGFVTIIQKELKKLIAYSSIAHMGFVTLGLFTVFAITRQFDVANKFDIQHVTTGIEGAMLQMLAHGIIVGALFLCAGILYTKIRSRVIADYQGLAVYMPKFAAFFLLIALANIGLPGTIGFVGEFFVLMAAMQVHFLYALCATSILIFSVVYTLWMYKQIMFGVANTNQFEIELLDITWNEKFVFIVLSSIIVLFGIWPEPILTIIRSSVQHLVVEILM